MTYEEAVVKFKELGEVIEDYIDHDSDKLYENIIDFFMQYILDFCNCGSPHDTCEVIRIVLSIINEKTEGILDKENEQSTNSLYENAKKRYDTELRINMDNNIDYGLLQFVMYVLDSNGLLEHGGGIGGCWITEMGKIFLAALEEWKRNEED